MTNTQSPIVTKFLSDVKRYLTQYGLQDQLNVQRIEFPITGIRDESRNYAGRAFVQTLMHTNGRVERIMLDGGNNVWKNQHCLGPE